MANDITFYAMSPVDKLVDGAFISSAGGQPDTPTISSVSAGDTQLVVAWPAISGATGYDLRVDGGTPVDVGNVVQYLVESLTNGVEYDIEVRAYNATTDGNWSSVVSGTPAALEVDWYVATTGNDTTGDGSLGTPYRTVQKAVDEMTGGDVICLRGGTYQEGHINLTSAKDGSALAWSTIMSYPGEWAVIDGENSLPNTHPNKCVIGNSGYMGQTIKYWKFDRLEIKNGRTLDGTTCGAFWGTYGPFWFRHCYIHDNYATVSPGSDGVNGGIRGHVWQNSIVEYCVFNDNGALEGAGGGHNIGDINIASDYVEDVTAVVIAEALQKNTYRYNLFAGSVLGIKYKNSQWLSLSHTGTHTTYDDYGDDIHHNIFMNIEYAIDARQDFIQIHNNIFVNAVKVTIGEAYAGDREPFLAAFYNNHLIGTKFGFYHNGTSSSPAGNDYGPPIIGPLYAYNNIIESAGAISDNQRDINLHFTYSSWDIDDGDIDMSAIDFENNLLMDRETTDQYIVIGDNADIYSVNEFKSAGYSTVFYQDTETLFTNIGDYEITGSYSLGGADTIANGGVGGNHPYLSGVTIPSYVGAANPSDQDWVAGVYGLSTTQNLIDATSADPTWIEG